MKEDKKKKKGISLFVIVLLASIFVGGVTYAYARLTTTLKIEGFASIGDSRWSVHFANLRDVRLNGSAEEVQKPTIQNNSTAIGQYDVKLKAPGDSFTYVFDVVNDGDIDAELSNFTIGRPICSGSTQSDERLVCDNLKYTITNQDGTAIDINGYLLKGETRTMKVTLKFNGSTLPQNIVNISGLGISLIYTQKN